MNGAERTLGPQRKGNQYLSISKSNHTLCLLSTCCVPSLGSGLSSLEEAWRTGRQKEKPVERWKPSPLHLIGPLQEDSDPSKAPRGPNLSPRQSPLSPHQEPGLPASSPSTPCPSCTGQRWLLLERVAGSSAVLPFYFSWDTQGDVGTATGVVKGSPHLPSPEAEKGERPRRPGPGLVQPPWSLGPVG